MYGIVSIGTHWRFLRWDGSIENPVIQISKDYACQFVGAMEDSKLVLRIIIQILLSAIKDFEESDDEPEFDETEGSNEDRTGRTGDDQVDVERSESEDESEKLIRRRGYREGNVEDSRTTEEGEDHGDGGTGGPARGYGMGMPKGMAKCSRLK